jgi:histidine triad (HIT) family protein
MAGELTEEDIRNMSPEQLRQLQKQQCIFCAIIARRVQARIVYEDEQVMGVLDINPANPGHVLLMPKEHYAVSPQMPDDLVAYMGMIAKGLSKAMLRALGAQGATILAANGVAAGQRASHFMMHVIPRREGDSVGIAPAQGQIGEEQLVKLTSQLRPVVLKAMGMPETVSAPKEAAKAATEKTDAAPRQETAPDATKQNAPRQDAPKPDPAPPKPPAPKQSPPSTGSNLDDITSLLLGRGS